MSINFNELPKDKPSGNALIPTGRYRAKIEKAEMKTPQVKDDGTQNPDYLNLTLDLFDLNTNQSVGKLWDTNSESTAPLARYKLGRLIEAAKLPITSEFELKDLTKMLPHKEIEVDVIVEEKPGKAPQSKVDALTADIYYPIGGEAPETTAPETVLEPEETDVTY